MKNPVTFISVIALVYCSVMAMRVPAREMSWTVPVYIVALSITHFFGLLGLQKKAADSNWYLAFFTISYVWLLVLAMIVAGRLLMPYEFWTSFLIIVGCSFVTSVVVWRVSVRLLQSYVEMPFQLIVILFQAAVLGFCGLVTLTTLIDSDAPAMSKAGFALSLYWIGQSAFSLAFALGIVRRFEVWRLRNDYVPGMLLIVCFGWLAYTLSGLQAETARQSVVSDRVQVMEVQ